MGSVNGMDDGDLTEALEVLREAIFTEIRVALPGKVVKYDKATRLAEVLPLVMRRAYGADTPVSLPVIPNVPVVHPQTQAGALILPVAVGDPVLLVYSDRSLDQWKASNGTQPMEAEERRKHELSDCWAIPGGRPGALSFTPASASALALQSKSGTPIYIGNGTNELLQLVHDLMDYIETKINFSTGTGPTGPPTNFNLVTEIRTKLETLKV